MLGNIRLSPVLNASLLLLESQDKRTQGFQLDQQDEKVRTLYGQHRFGQGCLLARRLVKKGVHFVEVEFGRTPIINENAGRDHHPGVFSGLMCGAGIRGGIVHGASDDRGFSPDRDAVHPEDFNATIAAAMGLPLDTEFQAPNGRPFKICNSGTPIKQLLS